MSFLHTHSYEGAKSELDFFTLPPTQTSIESASWVEYQPINSLSDDAPLEFVVPGQGDEYLELAHTILFVKVRIVGGKGENIAGKDLVSPVNNFMHSLFNQVDVFLNQKALPSPNNGYSYISYIETLLNYDESAKKITPHLWFME